MKPFRHLLRLGLTLMGPAMLAASARAQTADAATALGGVNDYPTAARADYVFACMQTNGGTSDTLNRCSCAIDVIAAAVPYSEYEKAETILRMRRQPGGGYLAQEFRIPVSNAIVEQLDEAQAEADVSCF